MPRRWASRSAWLVSTDAMSTVAVTATSASVAPTVREASKVLNVPRTLDSPRWRTWKWTPECILSTGYVPAVRGSVSAETAMGELLRESGGNPLGLPEYY